MKHAAETEQLFLKITDETPDEIKMKVDWSLDISTAIDDALHKKRMTQKELAARLGTSPASVSRWLSGNHDFQLSTLARISAVLGVPLINVKKSKDMVDLDYYALYLKNHLKEAGDPRQDDDDFITGRADAAAGEYERARRAGYGVDGAQELAMAVLLDGLSV